MANLTPESERVLNNFKRNGATEEQVNKFRSALTGPPDVTERFNEAVRLHSLRIKPLPLGTRAGATYTPTNFLRFLGEGSLTFPLDLLQGTVDPRKVAYVLEHTLPSLTAKSEAILKEFGTQPGVTSDQVNSLRSELTRSPELTAKFNDAVEQGYLTKIELAAPNSPEGYKGGNDKSIAIGSSSLTWSLGSTTAGNIEKVLDTGLAGFTSLTPQSRALLNEFIAQPGVTVDQVKNLESAFTKSPDLAAKFNEAVKQGRLQHLGLVPNSDYAGGRYSLEEKMIKLSQDALNANQYELIAVLGHELGHALDSELEKGGSECRQAMLKIASDKNNPHHDYTKVIENYLTARLREEGKAQISEWNTIVSVAKAENPDLTTKLNRSEALGYIYKQNPFRMKDFIERKGNNPYFTYTLKGNLSLNDDLTLSPKHKNGTDNVKGAGENYFGHARLGYSKALNYGSYYGIYAIQVMAEAERRHNPGGKPPEIDMAKLAEKPFQLSQQLMENEGINLKGHSMPYTDLSRKSPGHDEPNAIFKDKGDFQLRGTTTDVGAGTPHARAPTPGNRPVLKQRNLDIESGGWGKRSEGAVSSRLQEVVEAINSGDSARIRAVLQPDMEKLRGLEEERASRQPVPAQTQPVPSDGDQPGSRGDKPDASKQPDPSETMGR